MGQIICFNAEFFCLFVSCKDSFELTERLELFEMNVKIQKQTVCKPIENVWSRHIKIKRNVKMCSRSAPNLFPICSKSVPDLFHIFSRSVPHIFPICSTSFADLFLIYSVALLRDREKLQVLRNLNDIRCAVEMFCHRKKITEAG